MRQVLRLACFLIALAGPTASSADQTNAELVKRPVKAGISHERNIPDYEGDPIGDVEVTYQDGSKDRWTTKGNAMTPKVSRQGVVGWVLCTLEDDGKTLLLHKNWPVYGSLRLVSQGKILATISAAKAFIEEWAFSQDGTHVIVKSRASHGPATIEQFEVNSGKQTGETPAYSETMPAWAEPFRE
jgi:hypothetical protein